MQTPRIGPRWPRLGRMCRSVLQPVFRFLFARSGLHSEDSPFVRQSLRDFRSRLDQGETLYVVGIGPAGHNSGTALIEVSREHGIVLLANDEEERFSGIKHCSEFPSRAAEVLRQRLAERNRTPADIHVFAATWDYTRMAPLALGHVAEEFPGSLRLLRPSASTAWNFYANGWGGRTSPERLRKQFDLQKVPPAVALPHHENHAAFSWAASPFALDGELTAISVLDGFGDEGAISLYEADADGLRRISCNHSTHDSLGVFYSIISSTQGGWTTLSSEGRFMGAVAWGDSDRSSNPYYKPLRDIFVTGPEGSVHINRRLANWPSGGELKPYTKALSRILGEPIPLSRMWNPDAVLNVTDVEHSEITRRRVDIAAATQLVFEDVLFHIVDHLLRKTGATRLVLTGGTALNALANMKLPDRFGPQWFRENLNKEAQLQIWVPPTPGDAGVTIGAAYNYALRGGARPGPPLKHAFYCGLPASADEIRSALNEADDIGEVTLSPQQAEMPHGVARLIAHIIAADGVIGLVQGSAETGPRALGHRSVLANACNPDTLQTINSRVKFREPIRPLAPMVTKEAAEKYFELSPAAAADDYNAYNYMVMTVRARPEAESIIPAVIHRDNTARIQIVREETDPLCHAVLKQLGVLTGAEVAVNTSFNVGAPIAQTPRQSLETLRRAKAMTALVMISREQQPFVLYHNVMHGENDAGARLRELVESDPQSDVS